MKTQEEVKKECINFLEELIQSIKEDKTSYNYSCNKSMVFYENYHDEFAMGVFRYFIERTEIIDK